MGLPLFPSFLRPSSTSPPGGFFFSWWSPVLRELPLVPRVGPASALRAVVQDCAVGVPAPVACPLPRPPPLPVAAASVAAAADPPAAAPPPDKKKQRRGKKIFSSAAARLMARRLRILFLGIPRLLSLVPGGLNFGQAEIIGRTSRFLSRFRVFFLLRAVAAHLPSGRFDVPCAPPVAGPVNAKQAPNFGSNTDPD